MSSREELERYQFGLARSVADIPRLVEIATGGVSERWPAYWGRGEELCRT